MKKLLILAAVFALCFATSASAVQTLQISAMGKLNDSLTVANTQLYDTSSALAPDGFDYIGAVVDFDLLAAGGGGAGYIYFEGCISDTSHTWIRIPICDLSDSLEVKTQIAVSGTTDVSLGALISVWPSSYVKTIWSRAGAPVGGALINWLPYKKIRMVISDTNWTAKAKVKAYWVTRRN